MADPFDETVEAPAKKKRGERGEGRNSADAILTRIVDSAELFLNQDRDAFATINRGDHRETHAVKAKGFRDWVLTRFFEEKNSAPSDSKLKAAIDRADAKAMTSGQTITTCKRVGWGENDKYYLDLGDPTWRAVEADADGWRVVNNPPIRFTRSGKEKPIAEPIDPWLTPAELGFEVRGIPEDKMPRMHSSPLRYLLPLIRVGRTNDPEDARRSHRCSSASSLIAYGRAGITRFSICWDRPAPARQARQR